MKLNTDAQQTNQFIRTAVGRNNMLSAERLANKFMGKLQDCLNQCQWDALNDQHSPTWTSSSSKEFRQIRDRIKLRDHGPAIQMDVMKSATSTELFYSVDMVPTILIAGRNGKPEYYVAKPIKGTSGPQIQWRRSFSLAEKERLETMDRDNGCRKQVLRVLKVIRNRDSSLAQMTSYHLKTVLFRMTDKLSDPAQWKSDCLGERLMDVIGQLEKELAAGDMPNYFLPGVNLLDGMKDIVIQNMCQRLRNLKNSKTKMMKILQS